MLIGLVEDEKIFRDDFIRNISTINTIDKTFVWKSAEEFLNDKNRCDITILFLDIRLPHMNGIDLIRNIRESGLNYPIIILSSLDSDEIIFKAIKAGAVGYIHKTDFSNLKEVIEIIENGGAIISPTIALRVFHNFQSQTGQSEDYSKLSLREKQILEILVNGITTKEAAQRLHISLHTLRKHIRNIYKKLNINNQQEMMKVASKMGLI